MTVGRKDWTNLKILEIYAAISTYLGKIEQCASLFFTAGSLKVSNRRRSGVDDDVDLVPSIRGLN